VFMGEKREVLRENRVGFKPMLTSVLLLAIVSLVLVIIMTGHYFKFL